MLIIQNQVYITVKVKEVELTSLNAIKNCFVFEGKYYLPCVKLMVNDPQGKYTADQLFTEGNEIEIRIARSQQDANAKTWKFRVFNTVNPNAVQGPLLIIYGILNCPLFYAKANRQAIKGTSDVVLKRLAEESGLTFSGPKEFNGKSMNDSQTWLCATENKMKFAANTVRHAWADDKSAMEYRVLAEGQLRYRNLIDVINTPVDKINYLFLFNALTSDTDKNKQTVFVRESVDQSIAGQMAQWQNYGSSRAEAKLDGDLSVSNKVSVQTPGSYLQLNKTVMEEVEHARFDYVAADCGNTHDNYELALHQNVKLLALFTETVHILVTDMSNVQVFDPVIYRQADADLTKQVKNSDRYLVAGKVTAIIGGTHYAERIQLERMSLTMGDSDLKVPQSFGAEKTLLPDVRLNPSINIAQSSAGITNQLDAVKQECQNKTALLVAQRDQVLSTVSEARNKIQGAVTEIRSNINSYTNEIQKLIQPIRQVTQDVDGYYQQYKGLADSAKAAYEVCKSVATTEGLKASIVGAAGGLIEGLTENISQSLSINSLNNSFKDLQISAPSFARNTVIFREYNEALQQLDAKTVDVFNAQTQTWNYSVSTLKNVPYQSAGMYNDAAYRVNTFMQAANNSFQKTQSFVGKEVGKTTLSQPAFTSTSSWANRVTPFVDLQMDVKDINTQISRMEGWQ